MMVGGVGSWDTAIVGDTTWGDEDLITRAVTRFQKKMRHQKMHPTIEGFPT